MDSNLFMDSPTGVLRATERSQLAFVPNALPPQRLRLEPLIPRLVSASALLGQLNGVGRKFSNPYILIRPLQRKEAVASSNIEGTHTTLSDLFLLEAGAKENERPPDTREVRNYVTAIEYAIKEMDSLPISTRLIKEIHKRLLTGVKRHRGGEIEPGNFKTVQNFIDGDIIEKARFVPAPPVEIPRLMGDLENYIHSNALKPEHERIPPLILAGISHYQFETIHPFPDGNGRVGRAIIPLILKNEGALSAPLLYVSRAIEEKKEEYNERLYRVSQSGDWVKWLDFFLQVVETSSTRTIATIEKLHDLHTDYIKRVQAPRRSVILQQLINYFFEMPYTTIPLAQARCGISYQSAKNNVEKLVDAKILDFYPNSTNPKIYLAPEIYKILESV